MKVLKDADFQWHADQPDVPSRTAAQNKAFFDAPVRVLMAKINEIIGEGEESNSLVGLTEGLSHLAHDVSAGRAEFDDFRLMEFEQLKRELESMQQGSCAALGEDISIDGLPEGLSYAAEDLALSYVSDPEIGEVSSFAVDAGAYIVKTVGKLLRYDSETELEDGAMTVFICFRDGKSCRIIPSHDMYGIRYRVQENEKITLSGYISESGDPEENYQNTVPTVGAVRSYVDAKASGGGSSEMTELNCWSGSIDDLARGGYYVVDGASIDYYDSSGEFASTSLANGAVVMVGERMDWNAESGRRKIAVVFEPDGYRYLG